MVFAGNILHTVPYVLKHSDRRDRERSVACHRVRYRTLPLTPDRVLQA
jgi:hypothetical protein